MIIGIRRRRCDSQACKVPDYIWKYKYSGTYGTGTKRWKRAVLVLSFIFDQ